MPRIDAPTVAEHHAQRRAALLAAARRLLAEQGLDAVTLGAVGSETGLARSSVYQYFDSAPALIAAVVEDAFPAASAELEAAVGEVEDPLGQVEAYARTALRLVRDDEHRALAALAGPGLPDECRSRIVELHEAQTAPLRDALARLGVRDARAAVAVVLGLVAAGSSGASADDVVAVLRSGLTGLAAQSPERPRAERRSRGASRR